MVARVVRIENKKLPMKDATKGMQVIGLGDGAVSARSAPNVFYNDPDLDVARPARKTSAPRSACLFDV